MKQTAPLREGFWQRLKRNKLTPVGAYLIVLIVLICLLTPFLPLIDPDETDLTVRLETPFNLRHWLGTDELGRDLFSRLLWGTRVSLAVGFAATFASALIGSSIGLISGYFGGKTDSLLMRLIDTIWAFPYLLLALAIVAAFGPGLMNALMAIAIVNVPFFARTVRGTTVTLINREFIMAAKTSGAGHLDILLRELLPNVLPVIVVTISTTAGWMILETAGLSFLGLGAQPPTADLGSMLGEGRKVLFTAPHVSTIPGLLILVLVISLNLLGDGIRDILDPRLRGGAIRSPKAFTEVEQVDVLRKFKGSGKSRLEVRNLEVFLQSQQKKSPLVRKVDLTLKPGECLGLVGESGSGKSVTSLSICLLSPSPPMTIRNGSVQLDGEEIFQLSLGDLQDIRGNRIAYVFQDPQTTFNPVLSIGTQIRRCLIRHQNLSEKQIRDESLNLLNQVQLPTHTRILESFPHELSGGMLQRVSIAMALANKPEVLIADEPTTALDVTIQAEILKLLDQLRKDMGLALIFISHDLGVVSTLSDKMAVMYAGQVVETGETQVILNQPEHPYTKALLECTPVLGSDKNIPGGIPGLPPQPGFLSEGCSFSPRCSETLEACMLKEPNLVQYSDRKCRCLLLEPVDV
jgi:peptide/nickel transport system permease protein